MGTFDIISVVGDKKIDNRGNKKDITKVTMKMHQAVREDLLKYLESNLLDEEKKRYENSKSCCSRYSRKRQDFCNRQRLWRIQRTVGISRWKIEPGETPQEASKEKSKRSLQQK